MEEVQDESGEDSDSDWEKTNRLRFFSKRESNMEIIGVYDKKTKRYNSSLKKDRMNLTFCLVKTRKDDTLALNLPVALSRGEKEVVMKARGFLNR